MIANVWSYYATSMVTYDLFTPDVTEKTVSQSLSGEIILKNWITYQCHSSKVGQVRGIILITATYLLGLLFQAI